jgi:tetratricopeptide (TPR) repeat protein
MKIKITLFALLLSLISFGQDREFENVNTNYKNQNYTEAIAIGEKILQNQYGSVSPLLKLYTTFLVADSYKLLNKYPEALKNYKEYLEIIKVTTLYSKKNIEKATIEIQKVIDEIQSKLPNGNSTVAKTQSNETSTESSSNKTTTLVVTGQGKTKYEAQQNALRNAIEQAFGAFISSKTELLNDSLIKDEIVSVSNGNIQKFEEVSETILQNNDFSVTLKATVSVTKLTSFVESKGWEVEFKGALFGANLRQQKLNEEAEFKAILNLCEVSNEMLSNSLDYSLETKEPILSSESNKYQIAITVKAATNENFKKFSDYFKSTVRSICMTFDEVENYKSLNKKVYTLILDDIEKLSFRSPKTCIALQNLFIKSNQYIHNFIITTNIGTIPVGNSNVKSYDGGAFNGGRGENMWRLNVIDDEDFNGKGADMKFYAGTGYPNFKVVSKQGNDEIRFIKDSSWNLYLEYLFYTPNNVFFDKEDYFIRSDYDVNNDFRYTNHAGSVPGSYFTYIGKLDLSPWAYLSKYRATFSEEEIMKITGFTVKKIN